MSAVKVEVKISVEELFNAVEQMNQLDLEQFLSRVITLHAHRKATSLIQAEVDLFLKMHQGKVANSHSGYDKLLSRETMEILRSDEYKELLYLSEQIDKLQEHRVEYLSELARLHGISLTQLIETLGIRG
ncbi:hypothetical protein B6N60_02164 [Richelia sinica FACHB-800]|uniref:Uncharacterized protein n=1 Tax=Richelia sinica FACHB-800 TaxID=1357546 RepID=A0A975Y4S4_9NOST|nr:STAS/SEC14 domain-containing protein [Richelia sinica]MBD2667448.1 STAS/SEC14 domain-containing protein [Richelia sinica FACHB-800]QXE23474.1 hypothetical protein B6N60_02164 [Richelia sinica FACHB-800]